MNNSFYFSRCMSNVALACLVLLFCLGQFGCDRKSSLETQVAQPSQNAIEHPNQPEEDFLVGGDNPGWKQLFIQFDVNGNETRPFVLNIEDTMQPNDDWPTAPDPKKDKQAGSGDLMPPLEGSPRPFGWVSLNSDEVAMLTEAARKYFTWSDTATKENLNVEEKQMLNLTNQHFRVTFNKSNESSNSFMNLYVPDFLLPQSSLPSPPFSITLDKSGVTRLLTILTNLPSRRDKFVAFRDEQEKIVNQRSETQQNDKARADELLH